jgi:hypothetical protein
MESLYPIIRRVRRPLLPVEGTGAAGAVPASAVAASAVVPGVEVAEAGVVARVVTGKKGKERPHGAKG